MEALIVVGIGALTGVGVTAIFDIDKYLGGACLGALAVVFCAGVVYTTAKLIKEED